MKISTTVHIANDSSKQTKDHETMKIHDETDPSSRNVFYWRDAGSTIFIKDLRDAYEGIDFWRKNIFMLPTGAAGKRYINHITQLLYEWVNDSPLKDIALMAIHVMLDILLQKPSKNSKSVDHRKALERRLKLWEDGNVMELLFEGQTIQKNLKSAQFTQDISIISRKFRDLMQKGDVNGALKLLTNNMANGILPLNEETLKLIKQKHPEAQDLTPDVTLQGPLQRVHSIEYERIDEALIMKAARMTKGGSGPSGMDADGWRRILISSSFGSSSSELRKALAEFIKKIASKTSK